MMANNYHPTAVVSPDACVSSQAIIGCFVQVCSGANIESFAEIEGLTIVPAHVSVGSRARVGYGVCFIKPESERNSIEIAEDAEIGAKAIIHSGVSIGARAVIKPGSVVQRSIPSMAIVEGVPAKITGYVGASEQTHESVFPNGQHVQNTKVQGVQLHQLPCVFDIRGNLTFGESNRSIPFSVNRYFMVFDVPSEETRGEHAHRECHQFLICVRGSCAVVVDDGRNRQEFILNQPNMGIHLSPMVWGIQYKYSPDAVLLVFASHYYDAADYIRDYADFIQEKGRGA
jgi:acetyltransferase-like isoleucine patch superfamily enzyme/dTDP-4-dehydrorhamnose 3,5-epimerase-like enzyme